MAAANKAPPYPKQKYTDTKFREIIPLLSLNEYLKIEVLTKGVWIKMISKRNNSYNCECCGVDNVGPTPITDHVRGKKHRFALQGAEQLYHPNYTGPKNSKVPASTPILDAYNSAAEGNSIPVKVGKVAAKAAAQRTGAQQKAPAAQQKAAAAQQKASTAQQKTPNAQQKASPAQQKQQPKVVAKKPNAAEKVESPQTKGDDVQAKGNDAQVKTNDAQPKGNVASPKGNDAQSKGNAAQPKVTAAQPKENDSQAKTTDAQPKAQETKAEEKVSVADQNKATSDKKQEAASQSEPANIVSDVIELTDDCEKKIKPLPKNASELVINITTPATAKPQRPQKRNATDATPVQQKNEPEPKKPSPPRKEDKVEDVPIISPKKVINPAAVLAKNIESTENSPRYQQNRVVIPTIDKTKKKQPLPQSNKLPEVAAPSFSTKAFNTSTSNDVEGIIGVEYVVKILKVYNDPEPFYECCLCEVVMDGTGMQTHLLGYNHRYKYVEKHFPTCFNQYKEHIGNIQVMGIILDLVAKAIESHHGRELPYECLSGEFRSNRHGVMTTVYSFRHASEYSGPSFTNVVDANQIEEFYKQKNIYQPPKPDPKRKPTFDTRNGTPTSKRSKLDRGNPRVNSSGRGGSRGSASRRPYREEVDNNPIDDAVHKQMVEEFLQNTQGRSRSPGRRRRHRSRSRSRSRSPHRSSHRRHRRSPSPLRDGDVWQAYRHLVDRSKVELDQMYRDYRKDPEKHPLYDEEWRKFWKHRKEQIAREGLDYRNYDFQPEWVRYFAVRIEELYDEAVEDIKISSRRRLILPMTNDELEDKRYHVKVTTEESVVPKIKQQPSENKTTVVSVLRLLTALEDYLGSLGPRVVDLLSKALLVEKSNPREVNEIILNIENCTVLETAMEKLKGVLIAGLLEGPKVRAFNNVISETENILRTAFKIRQRNPQPVPQPVPAPKIQQPEFQKQPFQGGSFMHSPQPNPPTGGSNCGATANLLSQIDKKELAAKLAAALTAQGKTDFNPEQLQQLIAVYSLIDKKKRDSAAADKQKMTLSDTLTALLNPAEKSGGSMAGVGSIAGSGSISMSSGGGMSGPIIQPSSGRVSANYSNNSNSDRVGNRPGSVTSSSISNFVSMLNSRDSLSANTGGNRGDNQMWQNLQNIQNSLRMQNTSNTGGFNSSSMGGSGGSGSGGVGSNYRDTTSSGGSFTRSGFTTLSGGSGGFNLGQNSSMNFANRGGGSSGVGSSGDNDGFSGNFQNISSNYSRGGDDLLGGGRGLSSNSSNFSSSGNFSRVGGNVSMMGGNNSSGGFSRGGTDSFLGGSGGSGSGAGFSSNFSGSGTSSFASSGTGLGGGHNNFQRTVPNNNSQGMGDSSGSNYNRGGGFGNSSMGSGGNFNKSSGSGLPFGSLQRTLVNTSNNQMGRSSMGNNGNNSMGSNHSHNRSGSNWRNQ